MPSIPDEAPPAPPYPGATLLNNISFSSDDSESESLKSA